MTKQNEMPDVITKHKDLLKSLLWQPIDTLPENGYVELWIEYKDRSGAGFWKTGFIYKGKWEISGFRKWDYDHKEATHWMPHFRPAPSEEQQAAIKELLEVLDG